MLHTVRLQFLREAFAKHGDSPWHVLVSNVAKRYRGGKAASLLRVQYPKSGTKRCAQIHIFIAIVVGNCCY